MEAQHHFAVRFPDLAQFPRELSEKISVHGLHLKSQKPVQLGETVAVQFRFPQREDPLLATAIVAWVSSQVDNGGKRALIAKRIDFDPRSRELLAQVGLTPEMQHGAAEGAAAQKLVSEPPPRPAHAPAQAPVPMPVFEAVEVTTEIPLSEPRDGKRKRAMFIAGGAGGFLLALLFIWIFAFGGMRFIAIRFFEPPPAHNIAYAEPSATGIELPIPAIAAPAPVAIPPATAVGFDYFQRPTVNEFIVTFSRPIVRPITSRIPSPLVQTFYIEDARVDLEQEQFFLPFDMVRTVSFEVEDGVLRISFVSQNPHYLPEPKYEISGRELTIRFIATD